MKTEKPRNTQKKIKVLLPAKNQTKLANSMDCCRAGGPTPVGPVSK